jgi:uncharacterized protein YneF (UPF0154 family)
MNEKISCNVIVMCIIAVLLLICTGFFGGYFLCRSHTADNTGIERNLSRERELLARIGEYEQREKIRIARENERINAERERIERTENAIRAVRGLDRRSGDLLQELAKEADILADYFRGSIDRLNSDMDRIRSE